MTIEEAIEEAAKAMCNAYGIAPDAASLGHDGKMRRAWEARIKEARAAAPAIIRACIAIADEVEDRMRIRASVQDGSKKVFLASGVAAECQKTANEIKSLLQAESAALADQIEGK